MTDPMRARRIHTHCCSTVDVVLGFRIRQCAHTSPSQLAQLCSAVVHAAIDEPSRCNFNHVHSGIFHRFPERESSTRRINRSRTWTRVTSSSLHTPLGMQKPKESSEFATPRAQLSVCVCVRPHMAQLRLNYSVVSLVCS